MKSKRVLVTGASGFVGRPLIGALLRAGYQVRAAARRAVTLSAPVEIAMVPDFRQSVDWSAVLRDVDIVIHAAGLAHADTEATPGADYDRINATTTLELAQAAKRANIERFVFISSVRAQIGPSASFSVTETDEPRPTDHYGRSKLAAERALSSSGLPFTILRPAVIYGPQPKGNIKRLVQLAKLPLPLPFGGLQSRRSLLGIDNLIGAIFFVLQHETTIGETFLVADPKPLTLPDIFTLLRKALNRRPGLIDVPPGAIRMVLRLLGQKRLWDKVSEDLVVDVGKLESFGWRPTLATYAGFCAMLSATRDAR